MKLALPTRAGNLQRNKHKNRFMDILPPDLSRVVLLSNNMDKGSDYINASWMPVSMFYLNYMPPA